MLSTWALEIRGVGDWKCYGSSKDLWVSDTLNAVKAFLADGRRGTAEEIAEAVKRRREDVTTALKILETSGEVVGKARKGGKGRPATVYRATDFPSRPDFPSEGRDGKSGGQQLDFPEVRGAADFPSRISPPRDAGWEGKSLETPAEVEL